MAQSITHTENREASDVPRWFAFSKISSKEQKLLFNGGLRISIPQN